MSEDAPTPAPPRTVVPLEYAERERARQAAMPFRVVRQLLFSLGVGLFFTGFGCYLVDRGVTDAPYLLGWGAGIVALCIGWPGWPWGYRRAD